METKLQLKGERLLHSHLLSVQKHLQLQINANVALPLIERTDNMILKKV